MKSHRVCVAGYRGVIAAGTCYTNKRRDIVRNSDMLVIRAVSVCVYVYFSYVAIFFFYISKLP